MSDAIVTAVGNVATDVRFKVSKSGMPVAYFRLACHRRRYDAQTRRWSDDQPSFYSVVCFKGIAESVKHSLSKGDPVVVHGRIKVREWRDEHGNVRTDAEIDALSAGHDLNRGTTIFSKVSRPVTTPDEDDTLEDLRSELLADRRDLVVVDPHTGEVIGGSDLSAERPVADPPDGGAEPAEVPSSHQAAPAA